MDNIELSVIIPTYNEEDAIEVVVKDWHETLDVLNIKYKINVYNDGSKDDTLKVLNQVSPKYPNLIVHDKLNSGHGSTILKGYRDNSKSQWLFQVDSDNEIPARYFKELWQKRDSYDFIMGTRNHNNRPLVRTVISFVSRMIIVVFYGRGIKDVNAPYRLMRTDKFKSVFSKIKDGTFAPNVIISGYAANKKLRILQIPVESTMRETGEVSIKKWKLFKVAIKSFWQTISFRFQLNNK